MSTRSGKRIHSSFHENTVKNEPELGSKSEKKTRTKKLKENVNNSDLSVAKHKKRNNYVTYPTDDEMTVDAAAQDASEVKPISKLPRNTLKDHNIAEPATEDPNINGEVKKVIRLTRRTKKFAENNEDGPSDIPANYESAVILTGKVKTKKGKKKSKIVSNQEADEQVDGNAKKSKRKRKKGKRSSDFIEEEIVKKDVSLNKSNTSVDSYHSAAGSPLKGNKFDNDLNKNDDNQNAQTETLQKETNRKASFKNSTLDKIENDATLVPNLNTTFDKSETEVTDRLNNTFEKQTKTRKSVSEKTENGKLNSTYEKIRLSGSSKSDSENLNATFEKANTDTKTGSLNSTFDKETDKKLNTTFDKETVKKLNTTFDKETDKKLDTTFDKTDSQSKSSIISSDNTINVTFDKSDNSRISITSDDSRTGNIVNTTPLLIESSLEDSRISDNLSTVSNLNTSQKDNKKESLTIPVPVTPLQREGTFTKDGPDVIIMSPKPKVLSDGTPTKRMTLPSPGFTPFHVTRSSQREKSVLNITKSLEKSTRRSSLANLAPRQTKVMFCSPTNNPGVATQQKKKIIKSSMKGSNKSFVFDESACETRTRPVNRKRSYSSEAEPARAKRSRLAEGLQLSVERLSRPRTSSAAAKMTDNTPKRETPGRGKSPAKPAGGGGRTRSRTKLPNFAALHQKEFARMESLAQCQERKARRARELLTPRAKSTRGTTEKSKPVANTSTKDTKKLETPVNSTIDNKPTLETLRPGFTRFGFKMHVEGNPFSVPSRLENKPKENRPNGLTRQATLPSIKGAVVRKEAAKQVVMREKSFTSLSNKREMKRKEDRTIIKGVRTNRRFELQMQMRNIN